MFTPCSLRRIYPAWTFLFSLACWRAGVLACWRAGVLACWRAGVLAYRRAIVLFLALVYRHTTVKGKVDVAKLQFEVSDD